MYRQPIYVTRVTHNDAINRIPIKYIQPGLQKVPQNPAVNNLGMNNPNIQMNRQPIYPPQNTINKFSFKPIQQMSNPVVEIVNSNDLIKFNNEMMNYIKVPENVRELTKLKNAIDSVEKELLLRGQVCTQRKLSTLQDHLTSIDPTKIKTLLRDYFYDPEIMKEIACTVNSIYYLQPLQPGAVKPNERVKRWLRELTQIGNESVFGYAFRANFSTSKGAFIIKAPRNPNNDLLHEVTVGMTLNTLRSYVPNFAYVFGGFKCTPPIIEEIHNPTGKTDRVPASWCNTSNNLNITYAIYENIAPAISMKEYTEKCTFNQFLDKYLQILYALLVAQQLYDYGHDDLHGENVLIRSLDSSRRISIPYNTEKGTIEYLNTDGIATIIDYGMSHIKVKGQHLGSIDAIPYGVYPNRTVPLFDAYKLLMFSLESMLHSKNFNCYQGASKLYSFFNQTEPLEQALSKQRNLVYFLPYNAKTRGATLSHFLGFIRKNVPEFNSIVSNSPQNSRVLGCTGNDVCLSEGKVLSLLGANDELHLNNIFDFYDLVSRLETEGRNEDVTHLIQDFDIDNALLEAYSRYNQILVEIDTYFTNETLQTYSICGLRCNNLTIPQIYTSYKTFLLDTSHVYELFQEATLIYDAIKFTVRYYPTLDITELHNNYNVLMVLYNDFLLIIDSIRSDYKYLGPQGVKQYQLQELEVLARS